MRIIELGEGERAKELFNIIVACAFQGKAPGDLEGSRRLAKLQDAIEEHSATVDDGGAKYELRAGQTTFVLNDGPCELLKSRFFDAGIPWNAVAMRRMLEAYDAVCAAREVKAEDLKPAVAAVA